MVSSASCGVSRLNRFITTQFVLVLYWTHFGSVESLKFTDPIKLVDTVTIEINTTLNYSINCRTDDPNATTSLWLFFRVFREVPVGGRISLDRQVYTIHGLNESDGGRSYQCRATSSQGGAPIRQSLLLIVLKEMIPCCPDVIPQTKIMSTGSNMNFKCHVMLTENRNTALKKYLVFKWYKKENGTFVEVPDSETSRHNGSTSVLMIKNAKATPKGGVLYKCEILYRGRKSFFGGPRLVVHDLSAPNISELHADGTAVVNESKPVTVCCKADGYPVPQITWLRNGTQISVCVKPSDGVGNCDGQHYQASEFKSGYHAVVESWLTIERTEYPRDHGRYTCVANNSQTAQKDVEIFIQTPPILDKSSIYWPTNRKIHCMVTRSSPLPTFRWQSQNGPCLNIDRDCKPSNAKWQDITSSVSPAAGVATAKSTVTIPEVAGSGFYRCIATNVLGSDDHYLRFFAADVEEIRMTATPGKYDEGQTLKLRCVLLQKGSKISWYKDSQRLTHAANGRVNITWAVESDFNTWTELVVEKLVTSDSGLYTCEAQGATGKYSNASNFIKIYEIYPPTILSFRHQTVYQQTTVRLYCNITAHPTPTVKWLKDNKSLEEYIKDEDKEDSCKTFSQTVMYRVRGHVGLLVICHPSHAHRTGFYTCQAGNQRGNSSATAFLDVLEDPVIVSPSKELTSQPVRVKLGNPWNSTCKATGNPAPLVEWRKEKSNETVTRKLRDTNGVVLYMESVGQDDLGVYLCVAENSIKNSTRKTTARMEIVPDAPLPDPSAREGLSKETITGISVVGGAVFILCVLAITCFVFIRRQRKQLKEYHSQFFPEFIEYQLDPNRTLLEQCNNLPYDPDWEFPQERLTLGDVLGSGAFGQVFKAEAIGITDFNPRDKSVEMVRRRSKMFRRSNSSKLNQDSKGFSYMKTTVAVKTLKANATTEEYRDLASELKILIHVGEHKNIVNLLGACTKGERLLVILEYAPHGSLLKFVRGKRGIYEPTWTRSTNNPEVEFTIAYLVAYAYQICRGMEFLASRKCIHRDLAARNALVGEDYVMKIADFGLARDIYKSDLYVKTTSGVLPVKWMALESLFLREYTEKSDVWSFGVCLWEMFTLGGTPYPGIPTEELLDFLSDDHRMEIPENCPQEIYTIMTDCWLKEHGHRPTFAQLSERIGKIMERKASEQSSSAYISLTEDDKAGKNGYYFAPVDSGSSLSGAAAGYSRQSSEDIMNNPLPPLPSGTERERELGREERQRMLEPEAGGSLSENESGIELEEVGDEMAAAGELRPVAHSTGRARKKSKSKQTFV